MDELALLQRMRDLAPEPTEHELSTAFSSLEAAFAAANPAVVASRPVRQIRPRTVVLASVAAAAAVALVLVAIGGAGSPEPASASALLRFAAGSAITTSDPVASPGQYIKVETHAAYVDWYTDATGTGAYVAPEVDDLYIPADRSGTWVKTSTATKPTRFFGALGRAAAAKDWAQGSGGDTTVVRAPGGSFASAPEFGGGTTAVDNLATMPREPKALLAYLRETLTRGERSADPSEYEGFEFDHVGSLLEGGAVPADLRAGLYRALALFPSIAIADHAAVLDGRTGTSFSLGDYQGRGQKQLVIDPSTGEFIGYREVLVADYESVPAGTAMEYTAVTTTVVNRAP
jgi:hypothetical protein